MNKKTPILVMTGILLAGTFAATADSSSIEVVARLPQVLRPFFLAMNQERIYVITEASQIHIYRRGQKGVAFEKTFGHEGEGPGEFHFIHQIRIRPDHLDIPTLGKFARFSLDGRFLDEKRLSIQVFKNNISQVGDRYVVRNVELDVAQTTISIRLYDREFKLIRELGRRIEPRGIHKLNPVSEYYSVRVADDRIFTIESARRTQFKTYDGSGNPLQEITLPLKPTPLSGPIKERVYRQLREGYSDKSMWEQTEKILFFPDQTPGLDYFEVQEGKIYTRTYNCHGDQVEFAVFDVQGRELKRVFLADTGRLSNGIRFCFFQGRFFWLRDNPDTEVWELLSEKVL